MGKDYRFFYGIYSAKAMGHIWLTYGIYWSIGYILQKPRNVLWDILQDIFVKTMGYICKAMGFIQKDYGIYLAKTIGYIMGYIWQILWDIFIKICDKLGKSYGIYSAITMGYIG